MTTLSNAIKSFGKTAMLGAALASAIPPSMASAQPDAPAAALTAGTCGIPAAQVKAALDAQGQFKMIVGNRMALTFDAAGKAIDSPRIANVFTSNADGTLGYNIEGNQPLGTASTEFCVRARYTNIRFNDWSRAGVPDFARVGAANDAVLTAQCAKREVTHGLACGSADGMLIDLDGRLSERVMMSAQTISADGRAGKRINVLGQANNGSGSVIAADTNGVGFQLMMTERIAYTPEGRVMIQPRTASASTGTTALAMASPR